MKRAMEAFCAASAAIAMACASFRYTEPTIAPAGTSTAEAAPDQPYDEAAGKAAGEESKDAPATAAADDGFNPAAVVSLPSTNLQKVSTSVVHEPSAAEQMLAENNRVRAFYGRPPQTLDASLTAAAQNHANYLARTGRLEHSGHNGTPLGRARHFGFQGGSISENAAGAFSSIWSVFNNGWLKSTIGHRETLLSTEYDCAGFGLGVDANGQPSRWVALYGNSKASFTAQPAAITQPITARSATYSMSCQGGVCSQPVFVPQRRRLFGR